MTQSSTGAAEVEFPAAWQRAFLPLCLLKELARGPNHGYAVARALEGYGFSQIKGATLYPALARLELDGFLSTLWEEGHGGPGRKVYLLTASGREELRRLESTWSAFQTVVAGPRP